MTKTTFYNFSGGMESAAMLVFHWLFADKRPALELEYSERCRRIRELKDWPEVPQGKLLQETLEAMMRRS